VPPGKDDDVMVKTDYFLQSRKPVERKVMFPDQNETWQFAFPVTPS